MKALIVFYSMYGHVHKMAEAVAEGVREVPGAEAVLRRVPETLSDEILRKMGALEAQKAFANVPVATVDELAPADAIIFGTPTRFGNMCGQIPRFQGPADGRPSRPLPAPLPRETLSEQKSRHPRTGCRRLR